MDFITREKARQDILALGLPQIVLDAFDEKPLPYDLDLQFREPYKIFGLGMNEQSRYGQGRITPLWGGGGYRIVAYHHAPQRKGYFRFDMESGEEQQPIGLSWQQILVKEFKFLWELEWPDERLREVAGWFSFNHIDLLIDELSHAELDTFAKDDSWYNAFLKRIAQ